MEDKVRHQSLRRQKFHIIQNGYRNHQSKKFRMRKLLTEIPELCQNVRSQVSEQKCLKAQKVQRPTEKNSRFWNSNHRVFTLPQTFSQKENISHKENEAINWTKILYNSQKICIRLLKKRMENFKFSTKAINNTLNKLKEEENNVISDALKQFHLKL